MIYQDKHIDLFLNAINKDAEKRCKKIIDEANAFRATELEKAKKDAKQRRSAFIDYEMAKIHTQTNRNLALEETRLRSELIEKRSQITDSVFHKVEQRLKEYTDTEDYQQFILNSVKEFKDFYGSGFITIFVREEDLSLHDEIIKTVGTGCLVKADSKIILGGCKASCEGNKISLDDTFDTRLMEQRAWFYENSGLSILK